ncbi:alpha-1-antitrypsin homolog [Ictalurus furcatus]|uniref:alpha-1-antitrypsin homolog n=1 Tax=Ictalurus furcatus TaxID=66913 RepID=UPI00234FB9A1|nr:alpha-1-antitrypsin homolog [Ictalurus furcatus]
MLQKIQCCLTFALLVMSALGDHEGHNHAEHSADHHGESPCQGLRPINANVTFAFTLYNKLSSHADSKGKNIFFSPLSISLALSMLALGAKGVTHSQIVNTLGYSSFTEDQVNEAYEHLLQVLGHSQEARLLEIGGGLAVQKGFKPVDKFLKDLQQFYHAEAFSVDFSKPEVAVEEVNKFIAKKTKDTITDMIESLEPETIMVLINYIYFKGKWEKPFLADATRKANFYVDENTKVTVDMMKAKDEQYNIYISKNITLIKLPYHGNASMVIILPSEGKMDEVEKHITKDQLKDWIGKARQRSVELYVPKFSISASVSLGDTLKELGIIDAFSDKANFSGISEDIELKVSKVLHKAVLSVDEKGTEAAGATTVEIIQRAMPLPIKINRPFLVFIVEEAVKNILFLGKIINPTE